MNRRQFVALSAGLIGGAALSQAAPQHELVVDPLRRFQVPLPIPRVLMPTHTDSTTDYYDIEQRQARVEIIPGRQTTIWGYEGTFPGPTIKARRGRTVVVRHANRLSTPTVVHLHGSVSPPDSDGFPMDHIMPGESRTYTYPNAQRAATLWYHDHAMDHTGRNIYMGLAGLYLIEDDEERALGLPDGDHDVPLLIQDRLFAPDGTFRYKTLVDMPAWRHVGPLGWAAFSRQADLGWRAMMLYPGEAFAGMILSVAAAAMFWRDRTVARSPAAPVYAAALLTIGGLLFTIKAAPIMLSVRHLGNDPVALQRAFDGFAFWGWWRGVCQVAAYLASFWALVAWTDAHSTSSAAK
jgi:FtsP/CotA-like multicopper oxidase with cupredoxin domain